jgi:hypothetical protein
MTLLAGHFRHCKPAVWQQLEREMDRQVARLPHHEARRAEFDTQDEARKFAEKICEPPLTIEDWTGEPAESDQYWRELGGKSVESKKV